MLEKQTMKLKFHLLVLLLLMGFSIVACSPPPVLPTPPVASETPKILITPPSDTSPPLTPRNSLTNTPQPSPLPTSTMTVATSSLVEGWLVYRNENYKYEFSYPSETTLRISSVESFPEALPPGMTFEEHLHQLQDKMGDLCVIATYRHSFLLIQAPNAWDYVLCGGFGIGDEPIIEKSTQVTIDGKTYPSQGWELYKLEGEKKILYSEFFFVDLEDGTHIAYGASSNDAAQFTEYLNVKGTLLRMLASYRAIE